MDLLGLEHGVVALNKCDLVGRGSAGRGEARGRGRAWRAPASKAAEIIPVSAVTGDGLRRAGGPSRRRASASHGCGRRTGASAWPSTARSRWPASARPSPARCCRARCGSRTTCWSARRAWRRACARSTRRTGPSSRARPGNDARSCSAGRRSARKPCAAAMSCSILPCTHRPRASTPACACCRPSRSPIGQWFPVKVHHAAAEVPGRVVVLRDAPIAPGETDYVQLVLERPLAGGRRRPLRHPRHLLEPHRRRRHVHRSARAGAAAAHAGAPRRDRSAGANAIPLKRLARVLAGPSGWIDLDAFVRDRAIGAGSRRRHRVRPCARRRCRSEQAAPPCCRRPGSGCARASARRSTRSTPSGRTCRASASSSCARARSPPCPRRCSWPRSASSPRPARSRSTARGCAARATR